MIRIFWTTEPKGSSWENEEEASRLIGCNNNVIGFWEETREESIMTSFNKEFLGRNLERIRNILSKYNQTSALLVDDNGDDHYECAVVITIEDGILLSPRRSYSVIKAGYYNIIVFFTESKEEMESFIKEVQGIYDITPQVRRVHCEFITP